MIGPKGKGGAATPPQAARCKASGQLGRYHPPADPRKVVRFVSEGRPFTLRGKRAAFLLALIAAGGEGVMHAETMPWMFDPRAAVRALKDIGLDIETVRGRPTRWVLRTPVKAVQP